LLSPVSKPYRSPYLYSIQELAQDFINGYPGFDEVKRSKLIGGLLEYRRLLYSYGIINGFQWIDGSFVTNKELILNEAPNDIDVFSLLELPEGETQLSLAEKYPYLSDHIKIKKDLSLDTYVYFVDPNNVDYEKIISNALYFHGIWTQYRHKPLHKGYIRVNLSPDDDKLLDKFGNR
jgi:hypothetical protein